MTFIFLLSDTLTSAGGFHMWKWTSRTKKCYVKRNRSYNFCCTKQLHLLHMNSMFKEKSQIFDTMSLYTVGSMYRQSSVVRPLALCTVFCLLAQMHWKHSCLCCWCSHHCHQFYSSKYISALRRFGASPQSQKRWLFMSISDHCPSFRKMSFYFFSQSQQNKVMSSKNCLLRPDGKSK